MDEKRKRIVRKAFTKELVRAWREMLEDFGIDQARRIRYRLHTKDPARPPRHARLDSSLALWTESCIYFNMDHLKHPFGMREKVVIAEEVGHHLHFAANPEPYNLLADTDAAGDVHAHNRLSNLVELVARYAGYEHAGRRDRDLIESYIRRARPQGIDHQAGYSAAGQLFIAKAPISIAELARMQTWDDAHSYIERYLTSPVKPTWEDPHAKESQCEPYPCEDRD